VGSERPDAPDITTLLRAAGTGDRAASDQVFEAVYAELRRIARRQRAVPGPGATLSTTALVHETYLRLGGNARWTVEDRRHFFALAARVMRLVLIDHARRRNRRKRGGQVTILDLEVQDLASPDRAAELVALDEALGRLESAEPELAQLVEWRFFAGLTVEQIAELLGVSDRSVKRRWRSARAFLYQDLIAQGFHVPTDAP